ncbi:DUF4179 domain-containing protein [Aquibacillus rhizosphaerae]|uniref:DUF4179 domain-containing protein n=1 Tax=Aquibacillus rhizosphaerae TaxID=3051431 RepID=A0ABT7LBY5_9BACI|nr:DUF4179 domain-containing protein [Aquibacillus sp. LR5S19]MDL4842076.1 DUF4179 domain-containing protein [Aquibacillus sp. LR5S19]
MNDDIQKFKRKVDSISVPEQQLQSAISHAIDTANKSKSKKKRRYQQLIVSLTVTAVLCFALISSAFVSPVMARVLANVPLVGSVLSHYDIGLEQAYEKNLVNNIGETVNDRDIDITITEVYYDNFRLVIGYTVPIKEDMNNQSILEMSMPEYEVQVNGKHLSEQTGNWHREGDVMVGIISTTVNLPEEFSINVSFNEILNTTGNWNFEFPVVIEDSGLLYNVNRIAKAENYAFTLQNIRVTPSGMKIQAELDIPLGKENQGVSSYELQVQTGNADYLKLIEGNSKNIPLVHFDKEVIKVDALYEPLKSSEVLTIIPILDDGNTQTSLNDLAIEVNLSEVKSTEIINESEQYGLVEKHLDKETFLRENMIEEVVEELDIELGDYYKAEVGVLDTHIAYELQKSNDLNVRDIVKPLALIEETDERENAEAHAFVIYKNENGMNSVLEVVRNGGEWEEVDSFQIQGKTIEELEELFNAM